MLSFLQVRHDSSCYKELEVETPIETVPDIDTDEEEQSDTDLPENNDDTMAPDPDLPSFVKPDMETDWNGQFQNISKRKKNDQEELQRLDRLCALARDFAYVAEQYGRYASRLPSTHEYLKAECGHKAGSVFLELL